MKEKKPGPTTFETLGQVKNVVEGWCGFHACHATAVASKLHVLMICGQ